MEIVRAALDAANRDDWDTVFRDMASGFELDFSRAVGPVMQATWSWCPTAST